jgi:hypothetical protein
MISPALRAKLSSSYIGAGSLTDASVGVSSAVPLGRSSENSLLCAFPRHDDYQAERMLTFEQRSSFDFTRAACGTRT